MENSIGGRIKALRQNKGWNQPLLAERMGVVQSIVSKIESNDRALSGADAVKLAEIFDTSTDYILQGISPEFVNVSYDLGLDENAVDNLRNVQAVICEKGKVKGKWDNQDTANLLLSYNGWFIIDTLCDFLNAPKNATITVPVDSKKVNVSPLYCAELRSLIFNQLQERLIQLYDDVNSEGGTDNGKAQEKL